MGTPSDKDQLTKITVARKENSRLAVSDVEHVNVGKAMRKVTADPGGVMASFSEKGNRACISALIQEELHALAAPALASRCRQRR